MSMFQLLEFCTYIIEKYEKNILHSGCYNCSYFYRSLHSNTKSSTETRGDIKETYTGILPAADVDGIRYTLKLDYDEDRDYAYGDYDLVETYLTSDSLSASGYTDKDTFKSEGDFSVEQGKGNMSGKKYLKLTPDAKDAAGAGSGPLYFLIESDSTIIMVNESLQPSETPGLNYTLQLVK